MLIFSNFYNYALSPAIPDKFSMKEENICFSFLNLSEHFLGLVTKKKKNCVMTDWIRTIIWSFYFPNGSSTHPTDDSKQILSPRPHPSPLSGKLFWESYSGPWQKLDHHNWLLSVTSSYKVKEVIWGSFSKWRSWNKLFVPIGWIYAVPIQKVKQTGLSVKMMQ